MAVYVVEDARPTGVQAIYAGMWARVYTVEASQAALEARFAKTGRLETLEFMSGITTY